MEAHEYSIMRLLEDEHWWFLGVRQITTRFIQAHIKKHTSLKLLDAGCGTGGGIESLVKALPDLEPFGIDVELAAVKYCVERGIRNIARASVNFLPFKSGSFHLVTSTDVLTSERVNEIEALQEIHRVLENRGFLVINVPAFEFLRGEHDLAVHTRHRYTKARLADLLRGCGFEILRITYWNAILFPVVLCVRALRSGRYLKGRPSSDLRPLPEGINRFLSFLIAMEIWLVSWISLPFGTSVFCIAAKRSVPGRK